MKRLLVLTLLVATTLAASAQTKKVSILGDSYSTYQGYNPEGYAPFYPDANNDVKSVDQTWWSLYIEAKGYQLEKNNSWGGTTICGTGYFKRDVSASAFLSRVDMLGEPDIIFLFGGTNDAWARAPIGEYQYADWTKEDCMNFRPALACLLDTLQKRYPDAKIYSIRIDACRLPALRHPAHRTARHREAERASVHKRHEEHLRSITGSH